MAADSPLKPEVGKNIYFQDQVAQVKFTMLMNAILQGFPT